MWRVVFMAATCTTALHWGSNDTKEEFPFVLSMQNEDGERLCTCSLIAETWILTAGHCVQDNDGIRIRYADMSLKPTDTKAYSKIMTTFLHPRFIDEDWETGRRVNDLALIQVEKVSKTIGKLSAIDYKALLGLPVRVAGFGKTVANPQIVDDDDKYRPLQVGDAVVIPCSPVGSIVSPAICVASPCSNMFQDTRFGDHGGPLVYDGKIVGVLMGSYEETRPISFYAPVSPNLEWIQEVMKNH